MMESPYCRTAFTQHYRTSSTSLASHESGGSGTRRKQCGEQKMFTSRKGRRICHSLSVPKSLDRNRPQITNRKISAPYIGPCVLRGGRHISLTPLTQNEEWNDLDLKRTPCKNLFDLRPRSALKKGASRIRREKRSVTFAEQPVSKRIDGGPSERDRDWYTTADCDKFLQDSLARAESVRRLMKYAAKNESTYNSSIGLTSPQVLEEYLLCPEEIIGIEHLLAGQGDSRSSLKRTHAKTLLEEASLQKKEGKRDPHLLAEKLGNISRILSHMAHERALYIASLK